MTASLPTTRPAGCPFDPPAELARLRAEQPLSRLAHCYGTVGIRLQKLVPAVRNAGASLHWGIDDPRELEAWHPGLTCLDALRSVDMPGVDMFPPAGRVQMWILAHIPGLRDIGKILRYRY